MQSLKGTHHGISELKRTTRSVSQMIILELHKKKNSKDGGEISKLKNILSTENITKTCYSFFSKKLFKNTSQTTEVTKRCDTSGSKRALKTEDTKMTKTASLLWNKSIVKTPIGPT